MKNRIYAWIVLGAITIVAGLGLALTYGVTKEPIRQQAIAAEEAAKKQVMPEADLFEELELEDGSLLFVAKKGEEVLGYVGKSEARGYGGDIEVVTGVTAEGVITGINVGGSSFAETPGLGAKAKDADFTAQFSGKNSPVRLGDSSQDNAVDAITAATITSNAVLGAVNNVAKQVKNYLDPDAGKPAAIAEGTSYAGEAVGFAGESHPVYVVVTVKDDGTISGLKVGDERFNETAGYGAAALEPEFAAGYVGKKAPLHILQKDETPSENAVDAISGATVTTQAIINAINQAIETQNVVAAEAPEGTTYGGAAEGFAGKNNLVTVQVTIKEDGSITALTVGDENFNETEGYGAAALESEFTSQFIGKKPPLHITGKDEEANDANIDAISGATITTQAVLDAINKAYEDKNVISEAAAAATPRPTAEPTATPQPVEIPENALKTAKDGFAGPVAVAVTFDEAGKITFLHIGDDEFKETKGYGLAALEPEFKDQFIGKLPPLRLRGADEEVGEDTIDAITGATITSRVVLDGINQLHEEQFPKQTLVITGDAIASTKAGFMGPITVEVTFAQDGSIAGLDIIKDGFAETRGYGAEALEEGFTEQFLGKQPPLHIRTAEEALDSSKVENLRNVDAATSATVTMQAILDAINEAFANKPE